MMLYSSEVFVGTGQDLLDVSVMWRGFR